MAKAMASADGDDEGMGFDRATPRAWASDRGVDLSDPPPVEGGGDLWVDFRVGASRVNQVNTAEETAHLKAFVALYWTDPRMVGWEGVLPDNLWGPWCNCRNGIRADMDVDDHEFVMVDSSTGRMKRFIIFEGTVANNLDLAEFPFDTNTVDIEWGFVSHWRTRDGSKGGTSAKKPIYLVRSVTSPDEGDPIGIFWNRKIPEWELYGASWTLNKHEDKSAGWTQQQLKLSFLVGRHVNYYAFKILVPLYLLTINFATDFVLPVNDLPSRSSNTMTGFLAAFAFLYVVAEMLPKVEFLTRIDKIIVVTLVGMTLCGIEAWIVFILDEQYGTKLAQKVNWIVGAVLAATYVLLNVALLVPGFYHKARELQKWRSKAQSTELHFHKARDSRQVSPHNPTVDEQGLTQFHLDLTPK